MTWKDTETPLRSLLATARGQYSLLTVAQMRSAGFDAHRRRRLVQNGWITPVFASVYRLAGVPPTWRGTAKAATLAAGESAVLSHRSALALWGLIDPEELEGVLEVTCQRQLRPARFVAHRHAIDRAHVTALYRIPVTGIERTIIDVSEAMAERQVGHLIDEALRADLTGIGGLSRAVDDHRSRGGRRLQSVRGALVARGGKVHAGRYEPGANPWERDMDRMWELMGLPEAQRQQWVTLPGGWRYRPDRMIRSVKLAVEWDGDGHHGRRSDFERDIERRNRFVSAGWTVLDFHSHQDPKEICSTVLQVYRRLLSTSVPAS